jgi:hypothetical protein
MRRRIRCKGIESDGCILCTFGAGSRVLHFDGSWAEQGVDEGHEPNQGLNKGEPGPCQFCTAIAIGRIQAHQQPGRRYGIKCMHCVLMSPG